MHVMGFSAPLLGEGEGYVITLLFLNSLHPLHQEPDGPIFLGCLSSIKSLP